MVSNVMNIISTTGRCYSAISWNFLRKEQLNGGLEILQRLSHVRRIQFVVASQLVPMRSICSEMGQLKRNHPEFVFDYVPENIELGFDWGLDCHGCWHEWWKWETNMSDMMFYGKWPYSWFIWISVEWWYLPYMRFTWISFETMKNVSIGHYWF